MSAVFDWTDPLLLEGQLKEEERMARDAAADYCQQRLQPRVLSAFREERFDREILREMGELGLLASRWRVTAAPACRRWPTA